MARERAEADRAPRLAEAAQAALYTTIQYVHEYTQERQHEPLLQQPEQRVKKRRKNAGLISLPRTGHPIGRVA